ncbi:MAG TPA: hypothetical protein VGM88_03700 [Kofleriaceae bacterium]|jgi:hypothetical protein
MAGKELWERDVSWTATGDGEFPYKVVDGGKEYVLRVNDFPAEALYTLMSNGEEVVDLDDWPAEWQRPAMPANLREIAARELDKKAQREGQGVVDLDQIAAWADALCTVAETDPAKVAAALEIPGKVLDRTTGSATIEPAPLGSTRVAIGKYNGAFSDLGITLAASTITRAELDARLGAGRPVPMVAAGRAWQVAYRIAHAGAPYGITLFASFESPPEDATVATSVLLRREKAS